MEFLNPEKPLPDGVKPLPIVLLYCREREDSGGNRRFKCRAVVLGNLQSSTLPNFAPVISCIPGVRLLITEAIAKCGGRSAITLCDLSNAFLNAELTTEDGKVVVRLPNSWANKHNVRYALLKRALYGLKISPKRWYETIDKFLKENGWQETANSCLYFKDVDGTRLWMSLYLYVDDVVMGGGNRQFR